MIKYVEDYHKIQDRKQAPLWFHKQGLMQTATGYGRKLSTEWKVKVDNRWHRVYCMLCSNSGSLYIIKNKERYFVRYDETITD